MYTSEIIELISALSLVSIAYCALFYISIVMREKKERRQSRSFELITSQNFIPFQILGSKGDFSVKDHFDLFSLEQEEINNIRGSLNRIEAISIGVRRGFYDEDIIYDYAGLSLIRFYRDTQFIIEDLREQNQNSRLYLNFEAMIRRWENRVEKFL